MSSWHVAGVSLTHIGENEHPFLFLREEAQHIAMVILIELLYFLIMPSTIWESL